jgi:hypothetical protein
MDAQKIHAKIYSGRAKAALRLGLSFDVWRPNQMANPLTNKVATINAAFNAGDNNYLKPNMPGDAYWFGDFDGNKTQVGDYLVGEADIFFIAGQQMLLPTICVQCNRKAKVLRQPQNNNVGAVGYAGMVINDMESVIGDVELWPVSILVGGRSQNLVNLPSESKQAGWKILMPSSISAIINYGDMIVDDLNRKYIIESAELTDLWRITAQEAHS